MEDQSKSIMNEMEETRSSMTEKLEALENKVADRVRPMADAVERVGEAAAGLAENVKDSVQGMTQKVEETAAAVSSAFDLQRQTERHPWLVFGAAIASGCTLGTLLGRNAPRERGRSSGTRDPQTRRREDNGKSYQKESTTASQTYASSKPQEEGFFAESLQHLKGLAISSLMGVVRDMAKLSIPGAIGTKIAEEVDRMTKSLGAEPIPGRVLSEDFGQRQEAKSDYNKSAPETAGIASSEGSDRFRSGGGTGFGLR